MVCMLLEMHHWTLTQLYETDIDDLMVYFVYWPEWRRRMSGKKPDQLPQEVFADQMQF